MFSNGLMPCNGFLDLDQFQNVFQVKQPCNFIPINDTNHLCGVALHSFKQSSQRFIDICAEYILQRQFTDEVLGAGGRFWLFGGAAILEIPGTQYMLVDSPLTPEIFQAHRKNYEKVKATQLDWSMFSPGPMTAAENGRAHEGLRVTADSLTVEFPAWARLVPKTAWPLFLRLKTPESMTRGGLVKTGNHRTFR